MLGTVLFGVVLLLLSCAGVSVGTIERIRSAGRSYRGSGVMLISAGLSGEAYLFLCTPLHSSLSYLMIVLPACCFVTAGLLRLSARPPSEGPLSS